MKLVFIIPPFSFVRIKKTEKWLTQQALKGYKLVKINAFNFVFEKSSPKKRIYFLYKSPMLEKNDKFLREYFSAKRRYSLPKSLVCKTMYNAFEVDQSKIDKEYHTYFLSRTKHYLRYYYKLFLIGLIGSVMSSILLLYFVRYFSVFTLVYFASIFIYAAIAVFCLNCEERQGTQGTVFSVLKKKNKK